MKNNYYLSFIGLLAISGILLFTQNSNQNFLTQNSSTNDLQTFKQYIAWKSKFNKNYNDDSDDIYKFQVFKENNHFIENFNSQKNGAILELNEFSDLTYQQFLLKNVGQLNTQQNSNSDIIINNDDNRQLKQEDYPTYIDWSKKNVVSPTVPSQGLCGGCWAFATIGALEGLKAIEEGYFEYLSQQQLLTCTFFQGPFLGCGGSQKPYFPWNYTEQYGVMSLNDYPYVEYNNPDIMPSDKCQQKEDEVVFKHNSHIYIEGPNNQQIFQTVSQGPSIVSIHYGQALQHYKEGVISHKECPGEFSHHAVLLVGYDQSPQNGELPYFKIRNSLGPNWGENGYFKLELDDTKDGTCNLKYFISQPTK